MLVLPTITVQPSSHPLSLRRVKMCIGHMEICNKWVSTPRQLILHTVQCLSMTSVCQILALLFLINRFILLIIMQHQLFTVWFYLITFSRCDMKIVIILAAPVYHQQQSYHEPAQHSYQSAPAQSYHVPAASSHQAPSHSYHVPAPSHHSYYSAPSAGRSFYCTIVCYCYHLTFICNSCCFTFWYIVGCQILALNISQSHDLFRSFDLIWYELPLWLIITFNFFLYITAW